MACSPYFLQMLNVNTELLEQLDPNEMWLLLHIAKRISKERTAFPSKKTLLKDTRWKTERTLNAALEALVAKGFISVTRRLREDGSQASNLYRVETDMIGVFITLNELQDTAKNAGGGVQKKQGAPLQKMQGGGVQKKHPHEVLTSEVLNNEVNSFSNEKEATKEKTPNLVYTLYTQYATFFELRAGAQAFPRTGAGHLIMDAKDARALKEFVKYFGEVHPGSAEEAWGDFLEAAWQAGDKWIRDNFCPHILWGQKNRLFTRAAKATAPRIQATDEEAEAVLRAMEELGR